MRHAKAIERARQRCGPNGLPPLGPHGSNGTEQLTEAEYWARRLKRDRPQIEARFAAGEFSSFRDALRASGLIRQD